VFRNSRGRETDSLVLNQELPGETFTFEIRVAILAGQRLRIHFDNGASGFYIGNEGFSNQIDPYGDQVVDGVNVLADKSYTTRRWYDLRVEVDANHIALYKNGVLTHTARRKEVRPIKIIISPGDGYSEGHIAIAAMRLRVGK